MCSCVSFSLFTFCKNLPKFLSSSSALYFRMAEVDTSKKELDRQYSPSQWSHRSLSADEVIKAYLEETKRGTEKVREKFKFDLDCSVEGSKQSVDIYWPDCPVEECTDVFAFVHGGNWQACSKADQGYLAEPFLKRKIIVVALEYTLAPAGRLGVMVEEIRLALMHVSRRFSSCRLYVAGHSAGAHLAAMAMCGVEQAELRSALSNVRGLVLISGMYDLIPVQKSYVNDELHLTPEEARMLSPASQRSCLSCLREQVHFIVAVAEHDSLEYRCQSMDYEEMLRSHGMHVDKLVDIDGEDHFTIVEKMSSDDFILTQAILKLIEKQKS